MNRDNIVEQWWQGNGAELPAFNRSHETKSIGEPNDASDFDRQEPHCSVAIFRIVESVGEHRVEVRDRREWISNLMRDSGVEASHDREVLNSTLVPLERLNIREIVHDNNNSRALFRIIL